jgi:glycosyltransferase involved in cell wall biosynthesis
MNVRFSIIIPAYNAEPYIHELLECLDKQMTDEAEVILIDDGSKRPLKLKKDYPWISHFSRQKNQGISVTRNKGLELAKGEIINFLDADDMVSDNFISYILSRIDEEWDYMDLSWKSLEDDHFWFKLNSDRDSLSNPSASTRVFRRSFIGDTRFPEKKDASEDEHFTRHLGIRHAKHICATEFLYFYRTEVPNSNSKKFLNDEKKTKRIGYFFKNVTKDMTYLIDEIKKEDEVNEVFLLTYRNELPELEKYCQIWCPPKGLRVMETLGEKNSYFSIVPRPIKTQVAIFRTSIDRIGGIETFIYSFCKQMSKYYDITVIYDSISTEQLGRLAEICPVMKVNPAVPIICDTLIVNSIGDVIPRNITYKKSIQMVHCLKQNNWQIPQDRDVIVNVSQASKDSFGEQAKGGIVIHNLTTEEKVHKALLLVSALRVGADDKQGNDARCIKFAEMLDRAGIKYIWLYFGNRQMKNEPKNMTYCGLTLDIKPYIAKADYLVQLSGSEAFSYSLLEALELHTPVIVTPLAQNAEMGIVDGQNAYVVPFDLEGFDVKKILSVPKFNYEHDNAEIINQWRNLLGNTKPTGNYKPKPEVNVEVIVQYRDLQLDETLPIGTRRVMKFARALELQGLGFVRILD